MDHIKDIVSEFLTKTNLLNQYSVFQSVDFFNDVLKGKFRILKESNAYRCVDDVLYIECNDSQIMQEIGMMKSAILEQINHFLKGDEVKDLRFKMKST